MTTEQSFDHLLEHSSTLPWEYDPQSCIITSATGKLVLDCSGLRIGDRELILRTVNAWLVSRGGMPVELPASITKAMAGVAQGAINITEGITTVEQGSQVHKAMVDLCTLACTHNVVMSDLLDVERCHILVECARDVCREQRAAGTDTRAYRIACARLKVLEATLASAKLLATELDLIVDDDEPDGVAERAARRLPMEGGER